MKIAITGATGHIGLNMIIALSEHGHHIRAIYRNPEKIKLLDGYGIDKLQGNVLDELFLNKAFEGMDAVIHLAGVISINGDPGGNVMKTNVDGVRAVVNACLKNNIKKLIHFSSVHALKYSKKTLIVDEKCPYAGAGSFIYDQSKALGEQEILHGIDKGLNAYILNPTGVIGPHDYFNSLSGELFNKLFSRKMPALVHGGFDWVDVRDVINGVLIILKKDPPNRRYLLSGHFANFKEIANLCEEVSGIKAPRFIIPIQLAMAGLPFSLATDFVLKRKPLYTYESLMIVKNANKNYHSKLAEEELGYTVRPLRETIKDIFDWWKGHQLFCCRMPTYKQS